MFRVGQAVRDWWNQPDHFASMTTLLGQRQLLPSVQLLLTVIAAAAGTAPLIMLTTSARSTTIATLASVLAAAYVSLSAGFFAHRWPTRRQSAALATGGALVIAAWSLAQSDPTLRFLACAVLIIPGAYLAVLHNTRLMGVCFVLSAATTIAAAIHTGQHTDAAAAAASFCVLWLLNLGIPLGARGLAQAMTRYATDSSHDPLTGLLNRRGFTQRFSAALTQNSTYTHLALLLMDIDDFKTFNDIHGHPEGDRLLLAVAQLLQQACPAHAAICRAGGEEFLIAYCTNEPDAAPTASRLCELVAALPLNVTVSIGTTTVSLKSLNSDTALDTAVVAADTAMYSAKRSGGNQSHHHIA